MSTFLRVELASREGDSTLINVDHIVRIHPSFPHGCTIVLSDDTSLNVRASLGRIQARLTATNGRTTVLSIEPPDASGGIELRG